MQYVQTAGLLAEGLRRVIGVTFVGVIFARVFARCAQEFSNKDSSMYILTCAVFYTSQAFKLLALIFLKVLYKDPLLLLNPRVWAKACRFSCHTAALVAHTQLQCMKWSAGNLKQLVYKASGHMTADDYLERDFPIGVTPSWAQEDRDRHRHLLKTYNTKFSLLRALPLRTVSRCWGMVARLELPVWLRVTTHGLYVRVFDCKPHECTDPDYTHYPTISSFFRRCIRPELRPISYNNDLTSPADGTVLYLQEVQDGVLQQIKGVTYSLQGFLGPLQEGVSNASPVEGKTLSDLEYHRALVSQEGHSLYQCIVYLGPGDYHHFHSPADWSIRARRHFPGELFSVNPSFARWVQGMFNMNERAIYTGRWRYGFFSYTAVGATNVGSINVRFDPTLVTNVEEEFGGGIFYDARFEGRKNRGVKVTKGQDIGDFNMGSTIVLLFEAPKSFRFTVKPGEKIKVGQGIGTCKRKTGKWK